MSLQAPSYIKRPVAGENYAHQPAKDQSTSRILYFRGVTATIPYHFNVSIIFNRLPTR